MNLLLDTHALIWWLDDPRMLEEAARAAIADGGNLVFVSAASAWEMRIKSATGKLHVPRDLGEQMRRERFEELPIRIAHTEALEELPMLHRDPFDRLLVAQAKAESLVLVTKDPKILLYGGKMIRA